MATLFDAVKNFSKAPLAGILSAGATSFSVASGYGALFPSAGEFNITLWNSTDFPLNPEDDPFVEIVRVTSRIGDTFTVQRAQEGTADVNHNLGGKVYSISLGATAYTMTSIYSAVNLLELDLEDSTGTGDIVRATSPTLVTPNIGNATGNITGNAGTATALQNARTIGGVSFDGTANITVASATGGFIVSQTLQVGTNSTTSHGIELGNSAGTSTTPFIDFKFGRGVGGDDYNVRLLNAGDNVLQFWTRSSGVVATLTNGAFSTITSITSVAGTFTGNLTVDGGTVFVDASADRVGLFTTGPEHKFHHNTAGGGVYAVWGDVPFTGGIRFSNPTANAANGYNVISCIANRDVAAAQGLIIIGGIKSATEDTGSVPVVEYRAYVGLNSPVAVATRPTHVFMNFTTTQLQISAAGNVTLGPTPGTGTGVLFPGQVRSAVGSAAAPAYTANTATTTGMFISASPFIGFSVGGTMRMAITSAAVTLGSTGGEGIYDLYLKDGYFTTTVDLPVKSFLYSDTAGNASGMRILKARGTVASPTAIQSGDVLGGVYTSGYTSGGVFSGNTAAFRILAADNYTSTTLGAFFDWQLCPPGTNTRLTRMLLNSTALTIGSMAGTGLYDIYLKDVYSNSTKVLGARITGWGAPTGTATRTTFATSTVTTEQLAERLKALVDDLTTHGMIGA